MYKRYRILYSSSGIPHSTIQYSFIYRIHAASKRSQCFTCFRLVYGADGGLDELDEELLLEELELDDELLLDELELDEELLLVVEEVVGLAVLDALEAVDDAEGATVVAELEEVVFVEGAFEVVVVEHPELQKMIVAIPVINVIFMDLFADELQE